MRFCASIAAMFETVKPCAGSIGLGRPSIRRGGHTYLDGTRVATEGAVEAPVELIIRSSTGAPKKAVQMTYSITHERASDSDI